MVSLIFLRFQSACFWGLSVLLLSAALVTSGCAPKTVVRNGVEIPVAEAEAHDLKAAESAASRGETENAIRLLTAFVETFPGSGRLDEVYLRIGELHIGARQFESAIRALQKILEKYYSSARSNQARYLLGLSYAQLNRLQDATAFFVMTQMRDLGPKQRSFVAKTLAEALPALLNRDRQIAVLDKLLSLDEQTLDAARLVRGELEDELRRVLDSGTEVNTLISTLDRLESPYAQMLVRLKIGLNLYHRKDFGRADEILSPLVGQMERDPSAYPDFVRERILRIQKRFRPDPYAIGVLLPLSGPFAAWGQALLDGLLLAIESGEHGSRSPFTLHVRDTALESTSSGSSQQNRIEKITESFVYDENVSLIIGPLRADEAAIVSRRTESLGIPLISLSPKEGIADLGSFVFQHALTARMEARAVADFVSKTLGGASAAILFPDHNYGHGFTEAFWDEAARRNISIVAAELYPPSSKDFVVPLKKMTGLYYLGDRRSEICTDAQLKNPDPAAPPCFKEQDLPPIVDFDVLVLPDFHESISLLLPHLNYLNINGVQVIGTSAWDIDRIIQMTGAEANGAIALDTFRRELPAYYAQEFTANFRKRFAYEPTRFAADGFDTMEVIKYVYSNFEVRSREEIWRGLLSIKNFPGVGGSVTVASNGRFDKSPSFFLIDNGRIRPVVDPEFTARSAR